MMWLGDYEWIINFDWPYSRILLDYKNKNVCAYAICNFVHGSTTNGNISYYLDEAKTMTMHLGFVNLCTTNFDGL